MVLYKFFPVELQIVHINAKVPKKKKCTIFLTERSYRKYGASKFVLFEYLDFSFYAVRIGWRRKVMQANVKIPHEIKVHNIFNCAARSVRKYYFIKYHEV